MTIVNYDDARQAVAAGMPARQAARALIGQMTEYERLWCLDGDAPTWAGLGFMVSQDGYHRATFIGAENDRLGIPGIAFSDGPRGCVIRNSTAFPVAMARGATWDVDLEQRVGEAIGREVRANGATLTGAVCVNLLRHPAWGRAQETYGEDPFQVGEMGAAITRGLQQSVMACVKHFACNSMENARFSVDVTVDDVALHEVYLPHFKRIVDEGVASVMSAYNAVNGEWCGQSHQLLREVLREEWGFEGYVVSDWILGLRDAAVSVTAGLDIEMPYRMLRAQHLPGALERGELSWDDIDACAERVISTLLRFDHVLFGEVPDSSVVGSDAHRALAREAAARSVVVVKNATVGDSPALPISPQTSVAVIGALAATVNLGDGGSSDVWDLDCHTVLDGMLVAYDSVVADDGSDLDRAVAVAASAGAAVVVVGFTYRDEGEYIGETDPVLREMFPPGDEPDVVDLFRATIADLPPTEKPARMGERPRGFSIGGDRTSLRLRDDDVALIRRVAAANPRTVVAIQAGSAVVVSEWIDAVPAVVLAWYGGCRAGDGLADVLSGAVNPSARLPFSVPTNEAHLPTFDRDAVSFTYDRWHGWWHLQRQGHQPQFPFGWGLSYTSFSIREVSAEVADDSIVVSGVVANDGARDGANVVQVYVSAPDPDVPAKLGGFARVSVDAGGSTRFHVRVPLSVLAARQPATRSWLPAAGVHRVTVAHHVGDPDAISIDVMI